MLFDAAAGLRVSYEVADAQRDTEANDETSEVTQ